MTLGFNLKIVLKLQMQRYEKDRTRARTEAWLTVHPPHSSHDDLPFSGGWRKWILNPILPDDLSRDHFNHSKYFYNLVCLRILLELHIYMDYVWIHFCQAIKNVYIYPRIKLSIHFCKQWDLSSDSSQN
jgi:hypothetical protein